jgi:hypothetical protein
MALFACIFFAFIFSQAVESVQAAMNPYLGNSSWATPEHYNAFYLAATLVTNVWTYIIPLVFIGLAYWAWIYTQRNNGR